MIDATAGNGYDTLFLARLVGPTGHVYAFDVQAEALETTALKLREADLDPQTQLIHAGHENLAAHVSEPVQAILFNLGYLPGSDKSIITRPETTLAALQHGLTLLAPGGILTLVLYPGHKGGAPEASAVLHFCQNLDPTMIRAVRQDTLNAENSAPFTIGLERR